MFKKAHSFKSQSCHLIFAEDAGEKERGIFFTDSQEEATWMVEAINDKAEPKPMPPEPLSGRNLRRVIRGLFFEREFMTSGEVDAEINNTGNFTSIQEVVAALDILTRSGVLIRHGAKYTRKNAPDHKLREIDIRYMVLGILGGSARPMNCEEIHQLIACQGRTTTREEIAKQLIKLTNECVTWEISHGQWEMAKADPTLADRVLEWLQIRRRHDTTQRPRGETFYYASGIAHSLDMPVSEIENALHELIDRGGVIETRQSLHSDRAMVRAKTVS